MNELDHFYPRTEFGGCLSHWLFKQGILGEQGNEISIRQTVCVFS